MASESIWYHDTILGRVWEGRGKRGHGGCCIVRGESGEPVRGREGGGKDLLYIQLHRGARGCASLGNQKARKEREKKWKVKAKYRDLSTLDCVSTPIYLVLF